MTKSKIERIAIHSKCLGKEMDLLVYLPFDYDKKENLTTLYFLHGRSGDENILIEAGINIVADRLIENQEIESMIIVCPNIENSRGLNSSSDCKEARDPYGRIINIGLYEDYLICEVIPKIDNTFNTNKNRNGRYIGGASAGGYAALHNAFRHFELFSKVGGHMPAIELKLEEEDKAYFQSQKIWEKYDPITIGQHMECGDIKVYLDAGDKDEGRFFDGCLILNKILNEVGIDSQNHVFEGCHNLEYIKSNLEKYMLFYGKKIKPTAEHAV